MKLKFSLKDKEASLEADVEGIFEKRLEEKSKNSEGRKSRYQIKEEEKRKMKELEYRQSLTYTAILLGIFIFCAILGVVASIFNV